MLMQKKRFRFDNKYLYVSAAFVAGFGGIMTLLVHFAPINVPNTSIATTPEAPKSQEVTREPATVSQNDTNVQPASPVPVSTTPVTQSNPASSNTGIAPVAQTESPAPTTTEPVTPTPEVETPPVVVEPETPTVPEIPIVSPILDLLIGE